ncbi:MAG: phospholipase [Planctomycetota bacterium]
MADRKLHVVFVHGWSVTHTNTYGGLPERLVAEAKGNGLSLSVRDVWLGKYVSFRDEVRLADIAQAFEAAVQRDLGDLLEARERFVAITHSTGGPVLREWWQRFHPKGAGCPMSHCVMLAPANFGSALAQLGKARVGRLKSWFAGVEPGQGVLDWLELGSPEAWALNEAWIAGKAGDPDPKGVLPFVLTGQTIDRKLYDNLNSYTGELGSDGVVRVASANLNATHLELVQEPWSAGAKPSKARREQGEALRLSGAIRRAPATAFRLIPGAAHSGKDKGILRAVSRTAGSKKGEAVVGAILRALAVRTRKQYDALREAFAHETRAIHRAERVEVEDRFLLNDRIFVHDRNTQVMFRVHDDEGHAITDFDLLLTGHEDDPNQLPAGFFEDRQQNSRHRATLTYFINHSLMTGSDAVVHDSRIVRPERLGIDRLGLTIRPRPTDGFVHFAPAYFTATPKLAKAVLRPDETVMIDIVLCRIVRTGVMRLSRGTKRGSFKGTDTGPVIEG